MDQADENKGIVSGGFEEGHVGERGVAGPGGGPALLRTLAAVVLAAVTAGLAFLVVVEWFQRQGWTEIRFNHSLGVMVGGEGTLARTDAALGVAGDTAAPTGLIWFMLICIAVMAVHALVVPRLLPRRGWPVQALPLAGFVYVLIGLVYMPLVGGDRVPEVSAGPFGAGAGALAPLWFLIGSLVFAGVASRVYSLVAAPRWWVEKQVDQAAALAQIEGMGGLRPDPLDPDRPRGSGGMVPPSGS